MKTALASGAQAGKLCPETCITEGSSRYCSRALFM